MKRLVSVWLPLLATERLRRSGCAPPDDVPFAVAAPGNVRRITAVTPAARRAGIVPGMNVADAMAIFPALALTPADEAADRALLDRLADWCSHYTPWAAADPWPLGFGLWLDVTGCAHLFGGEEPLLTHLTARLRKLGFTARAAMADTPGAAWAWARFGAKERPCLPSNGLRDALAPLPAAALRLAPETAATLSGLGLRRVGDLYHLPRAGLAARFGREVARRLDQALGHEAEPISPRRPPPSHGVHAAFAEPIARPEDVAEAVRRLLERLCHQLAEDSLGLRRLEVTAFRVDATTRSIAIGTSRPSHDPRHLFRLLGEDLPALDAGFGIEMLRLSALEVAPQDAEQRVMDGAGCGGDDDFARLLDSLGNRLGFDRVMRLVPQQSHVPERAVRRLPPAAPVPTISWPARRRPVRLFARPELVEAVAPVPDSPPVMFRWRNRSHRVVRADNAERIADEWWRRVTPERDYYLVEDEAGRRFWLYREGLYGAEPAPRWYLHGIFP
jgi:protein ImuB